MNSLEVLWGSSAQTSLISCIYLTQKGRHHINLFQMKNYTFESVTHVFTKYIFRCRNNFWGLFVVCNASGVPACICDLWFSAELSL